ncbi:hypothetical protein ACQQ2Q_01950 [Agrobacterium sp. ES01]|uniref:hypothetical protein n=1 Tax=Agrobacterium sp. ES01 TaxID=3420714 RepID=UPI003D0C5A29
MTTRIRPMHCNFETLRLAGDPATPARGYNRGASSTNEQLSARATSRIGRIVRPAFAFAVFREV